MAGSGSMEFLVDHSHENGRNAPERRPEAETVGCDIAKREQSSS
jgi:hypothetical protein